MAPSQSCVRTSAALTTTLCMYLALTCVCALQARDNTSANSPPPPTWPESQIAWTYRDTDWSILAGHSFYWSKSRDASAVYGHFFQDGNGKFSRPGGAWGNYTTTAGFGYWPVYGMFGWPMECVPYPFPPEPVPPSFTGSHFTYDVLFNNCQVPDNYTYVGQRMINGTLCDGYHFIAVNYPAPQGNVMWTAVNDPHRRPVRMDIIHNGRFVFFEVFAVPAPVEIWGSQNVFCTGVSTSGASSPGGSGSALHAATPSMKLDLYGTHIDPRSLAQLQSQFY